MTVSFKNLSFRILMIGLSLSLASCQFGFMSVDTEKAVNKQSLDFSSDPNLMPSRVSVSGIGVSTFGFTRCVPLDVIVFDSFSKEVSVKEDTLISLSAVTQSKAATGEFYFNDQCTNRISSQNPFIIESGSPHKRFFYKSTNFNIPLGNGNTNEISAASLKLTTYPVTFNLKPIEPTLVYGSPLSVVKKVEEPISITPSVLLLNGAYITDCKIKPGTTALPSTLSINSSTCVISGTPTKVLPQTTYTIVASNSAGTSSDAKLTLTVNANTPVLSYQGASGTTVKVGELLNVSPTIFNNRGASVTSCQIKPGTIALPSTLTINSSTCDISGTPTAVLPQTTFTLVASNAAGTSSDATVTLRVDANTPVLSYQGAIGTTVKVGELLSVSPTTLNNRGASVTSCQIKPGTIALPPTLTINSSTCAISGTPTAVLASTTFTIIATNSAGSSNDATVILKIDPNTPILSYSTTVQAGLVGSLLSVSPSQLNNRGASVTSCQIKPGTTALPLTLTINSSTCAISGTPNGVLASTTFTIIATNSAGSSNDATVTLKIDPNTPILSYSSTVQSGLVGSFFSVSPSQLNTRGAPLNSCQIKPGTTALPSTLTINNSNCVVSGTPTAVLAQTTYTIVASNSAGTSSDATLTLKINANIPVLSFQGAVGTVGQLNIPMRVQPTSIAPNGATITDCGLAPGSSALPSGLSINNLTCVISGSPTQTLAATTFIIRAANSVGYSLNAEVTLEVKRWIYVATANGLSAGPELSAQFTTYTTAQGLGSNFVKHVFISGSKIYAGTTNGLSISNFSSPPQFENYFSGDSITALSVDQNNIYWGVAGKLRVSSISAPDTYTEYSISQNQVSINGIDIASGVIYVATTEGLYSASISNLNSFSLINLSNPLSLNGVAVDSSQVYMVSSNNLYSGDLSSNPVSISTTCSISGSNLINDVQIFSGKVYAAGSGGVYSASVSNFSCQNLARQITFAANSVFVQP